MVLSKKDAKVQTEITDDKVDLIRHEFDDWKHDDDPDESKPELVARLSDETKLSRYATWIIMEAYDRDFMRPHGRRGKHTDYDELTPQMKAYLVELDPKELTLPNRAKKFNSKFYQADVTPLSKIQIRDYRIKAVQDLGGQDD